MLILASINDLLRVQTANGGGGVSVDVHASWADLNGTTVTPSRTNTATITSETTTTVVGSPASSTYRTVRHLSIRNRHATNSIDITVIHTDGTNAMEIEKVRLAPGDQLHYDEHAGFSVFCATSGARKIVHLFNQVVAVSTINAVVLASDFVNNDATANTIKDITGMSFSVTAGLTYWFRFTFAYDSAATTTGSRWAINGPGSPTLCAYTSRYTLTATTETFNYATAYDTPSASNATSLTTGNVAVIEGIIKPSSNGTVIARMASEVTSSAVTAKAGSLLLWARCL